MATLASPSALAICPCVCPFLCMSTTRALCFSFPSAFTAAAIIAAAVFVIGFGGMRVVTRATTLLQALVFHFNMSIAFTATLLLQCHYICSKANSTLATCQLDMKLLALHVGGGCMKVIETQLYESDGNGLYIILYYIILHYVILFYIRVWLSGQSLGPDLREPGSNPI